MNIRSFVLPAVLALGAVPLAAEQGLTCSFTTECVDTEACDATSYDIAITHKDFDDPEDGMDTSAVWIDDTATRNLLLHSRTDILSAKWAENDGRQFGRLMTDGNGEARYVVMDSSIPMMISYYGTCKEAE